jgi:hypothetical protein|tara:strand:- start:489 stop:953 length:465 start_codon:yes stop_codon:yes gene_type:complete
MATSTLLQKLFASDEGASVGADSVLVSNRRQVETFIASEAISDGDFVCLDLAKSTDGEKLLYIKKLNSGAGATVLAIGVADEAIGSGEQGTVVIKGFKKDANVATGGNTGDRICGSSTGGRATQYAASQTQVIIGYQLEAASGNQADVVIVKQF